MPVFFYAWIILLGASFGSFFYAVADRLEKKKSFLWERSQCDTCQKVLQPWEMIPILSYLFQRGRCLSCHSKISFFHPIIESVFGLFLVLCILKDPRMEYIILHFFNFSLLFLMAYTDKKHRTVRNLDLFILGIGNIIFAVVLWVIDHKTLTWGFVILLMLNGLVILTKERYMGLGDTIILACLSLTMSSIELFYYIYAILIPAGTVSAFYLLKGVRKKKLALVPFLWIGYLITAVVDLSGWIL